MKKVVLACASLVISGTLQAQKQQDSVGTTALQEVIVIKTNTKGLGKETKPLGSIDEYLQKSPLIEMIRRGAYAWEPTLNGMSTERSVITIDGMRIFGACTDKMDPITSYVEVSNLSAAKISSGQQGAAHGGTIGGGIDLIRNKGKFGARAWNFNLITGFESVNQQKIIGGGLTFRNSKWYSLTNFMLRDAKNYKAGNGLEIKHSQFKKINFSETLGFKVDETKTLEASVIYDKASDVGYPALPMDVSLAEAFIGSVRFRYQPKNSAITDWETKWYFNHITHRMDDTHRPEVLIHMDMPGWSKTYGYYSKLSINAFQRHHVNLNLNGFVNTSLAEMTMYPTNPTEKPMFMLTWPDVKTWNQNIAVQDHINLSDQTSVQWLAGLTYSKNTIESTSGLESLQIFYPEMRASKSRILKNLAVNFEWDKEAWKMGLGVGYGERAPSVSEGYGFYLFNSAEKYDYIGNPNLKNEKALETNAFLQYKKPSFSAKWYASYFEMKDYIIGKIIHDLIPMTLGASGVKAYESLDYARLFNLGMDVKMDLSSELKWENQLTYHYGKDDQGNNLPYVSPLAYKSGLSFQRNHFGSDINIQGNAMQFAYGKAYGESKTPAYAIINLSASYHFQISSTQLLAKIGVDNLLDTYYTTFSDWNKIPRPGRNFWINLSYSF